MKILIKTLIITVFILIALHSICISKVKTCNISIINKCDNVKEFRFELFKFVKDDYYLFNICKSESYSELPYNYKINKTFNVKLISDSLYMFKIQPYNISKIFYPEFVDSLKITIDIDSTGEIKAEYDLNDPVNIGYYNFVKLMQKFSLGLQKFYREKNIENYKKYCDSVLLDTVNIHQIINKDSLFYKNYISNKVFEAVYYEHLLSFINRNYSDINDSSVNEVINNSEVFLKENNDNQFFTFERIYSNIISAKAQSKLKGQNVDDLKLLKLKIQLCSEIPISYREYLIKNIIFGYYEHQRIYEIGNLDSIQILLIDSVINPLYKKYSYNFDCLIKSIKENKFTKTKFDYSLFTDSLGNKIDSKKISNKIVLVNMWASWCGPCIEKLPLVKKIGDSLKNNDLFTLNLSLDVKLNQWKSVVNKYNIENSFITYGSYTEFTIKYKINYIPRAFLIDKNGYIIDDNFEIDENSISKILTFVK